MSKDQHDDSLKYGQGILLQGFTDKKQDDTGFLTAKGFADTTAKYQTFKNILYFKNYRNAIFQIIPAANFQINDQLRQILQINSQETPNVKILRNRAESERQQFLLTIQNKQKQPVCFGDSIIFKHVDSGTYLSGTIRPSNGSNGAFTVEVTKQLSQSLVFKVLPFRSYQRIGMCIPFESPVKLLNSLNNGYLTFQKIGIKTLKAKVVDLDKTSIKADDSYVIPVKTNSSQSLTYQCVTHFDDLSKSEEFKIDPNPMPWQFKLHMCEVENDSLIQHDIIYFQHTENNGILSTNGKQIILKQMKNEGGDQLPFYQCLWEIQKYKQEEYKQRGDDANQHAYILRHLMSGMTLGIKKISQKNYQPQLVDISEGSEYKLGWVQLKLAKKQIAQINSSSLINICFSQFCLDKVKDQITIQANQHDQVSSNYFSISKLNRLAVNQLQYEVKKVKFTLDISKNCFIIKQIDNQLKNQVLFALSFHSKIIDLREDLKWGYEQSQKKISYIRMMQVTQKIKQIKVFLKNCSKQVSDHEHIKPIFKRQMICKDLGISQLLFQLLFYMRANLAGKYNKNVQVPKQQQKQKKQTNRQSIKQQQKKSENRYIFSKKHNQFQKFQQLYNTIYEVIYELVRGNLLFKIYVSKWINFIIEDFIMENQPNHLKLLKQLFKNNQFLVKNFVDDVLIQKLVSKMIFNRQNFLFVQKKYLQLFRLFCIVGDKINTSNQIHILNKFIKQLRKNDITCLYQITLTKKDDQIYTDAAIDKNLLKKRRFNDYYKICRQQYSSAWQYFVQYLNLVSDMTKGRNKIVQSYMQTLFTLDILTDLFNNYELFEAQAPITRLLHNLYIQSDKFYPIEKKKRINQYQLLRTQPIQVMVTNSMVKPWETSSLIKILNGLRNKLKKHFQKKVQIKDDKGIVIQVKNVIQPGINPIQTRKNEDLYQILSFICQTLNLGFWQKKQKIQSLLQDIMIVIQPHKSIINDYSSASIQTQQNILVMKCKQQCMNIIQLILDYDIDLSVKTICKIFQSFQMPPKKRELVIDEKTRLLQKTVQHNLAMSFISSLKSDEKQLVQTTIIQKMMQLSKYKNPKLTSGSLSIMQRVLLKKKKAIQHFCNQIFVCELQRLQLKKYIQQKKNKFYIMQDQTLVKIKDSKQQQGNYVSIYKEDNKDTGIMQDIFMMSEVIKNEYFMKDIKGIKTLEGSGLYNKLGQNRLINFTDERTSSNIYKQSVLDSQNVHEKVIQFVLNCRQVLPQKSIPLKLLHLSYRFLVSLIWNNQYIKPSLINYVPHILHQIKKNVGCIDFLKQMYDNNKNMLFNEVNVIKLIKEICNTIQIQPKQSFYKSKLLDFFRFLIYCNGISLKFNQIQILKIMQDDSYKNINPIPDLKNVKKTIKRLVQQYINDYNNLQKKDLKDNRQGVVIITPQLLYLISYFQILQSLIDDRNTVNMGKLKKRFPFEQMVEWIVLSDRCWPLKRNIRAFLNRLYYFEPQIQVYMKVIIQSELKNIIFDLNQYILIKCKSNSQQIEHYIFQNSVRFTYLQSYLYLNLEQNLFTLYQLTTRQKIMNQMKNILHPLEQTQTSNNGPYNIIRICQRLGFIKNFFAERKNVFSSYFIKFLLKKFRDIIVQFDDSIYLDGMNMPTDQRRAPTKGQKQKARVGLIQKIMRGDISTFYIQDTGQYNQIKPLVYKVPQKISNPKDDRVPNQPKILQKLREILQRKKRPFRNLDEQVTFKHTRLVRAIKLSEHVEANFTKIYNNNLNAFCSSEQIFVYITTIIKMNSENSEALPMKQKIFFLNLITSIVQNNNKSEKQMTNPLDEWDAQDWIQSKEDISKIQAKLKSCDLGRFITQLLKQNIWDNIEFSDAILLCGISYLFGGNTNTQKNMIDVIKQDKQNRVMKNIQTLISKLGKFILKSAQQTKKGDNNDNNDFNPTTIDNYDFYDVNKKYVYRKNVFESQTTDEEIYYKTCVRTYRRSFKFLQLLCQNNNIEGKNFIKDQKNDVKNYDFISIAAKQLRNLFISLNQQICGVTKFLLDFILQVTQIPVKNNQAALMNLTFFQDVCTLQNTFSKPDIVSLRGFQKKEYLIQQIYYKTIQIILSNFEGNQQKTFLSLDNKLQPKFLVNILCKQLQKMNIKSKQDVIKTIDNLQQCVFDEDMMTVLNIIIIFLKLKQKLGLQSRIYSMYQTQKYNNIQLYQYLQKLLLEIQIINFGSPQTIIFPKYPVFNSLSQNLKDSIMSQVSRQTHRDKIVSLLGYTGAVKSKIQHSYSLLKVQKISQNLMNQSFKISAIMSIVVCIYMMLFYDVIINYQQADFQSSRIIGLGRFALSLIQLSMTIIYVYYWIKFKIWEQPLKQSREGQKKKIIQEIVQEEIDKGKLTNIINKLLQILKYLKIDQILSTLHYYIRGGNTIQPLYKSAQFYRVAIYLIISFFGTFFTPVVFFIHIMDIFCYNDEIGDIFKAIAINIKQLGYVCGMGVIFTIVFCTVTFSNYQKNVYSQSVPEQQMCQTIKQCILQLFVSGAISQTMDKFEIVRFGYDTIYGIFFGILFSSIISGIMLDSFAELRDRNNQILEDKQNFCYICNIDRSYLQKNRINFKDHIHGKHFLWNYVFYIYYLDNKSQTDYSGMEYQITNQYNTSDEEMKIDWIPMNVEQNFDSKVKLQQIKQKIQQKFSYFKTHSQKIKQQIKAFKEKLGDLNPQQ